MVTYASNRPMAVESNSSREFTGMLIREIMFKGIIMACPRCTSDTMLYGPIESIDEMTMHRVECNCGFIGKQWEDREGKLFFTDQNGDKID